MRSKNKSVQIIIAGAALLFLFCIASAFSNKDKKGILRITFINTANGKPVVLRDSMYTTPSGENYNITKLRYYISNISLAGNKLDDADNYQLIDQSRSTSFDIPLKKGSYKEIRFLLGIDSARNCSGAQDGALDPMNDMFWTWNSGYVMFKFEGTSSSSTVKKRIEHHIGGYRFGNNVATPVALSFDEIKIDKDQPTEIFIEMNLDKYWSAANTIKINQDPVCTLPGELAKKIAANFPYIFTVISKR